MAKKEFIVLGSDHAGFLVKEYVKKMLINRGMNTVDVGAFSKKPVDYPDIAKKAAKIVLDNNVKGILVCGTGVGMCIAANKIKGIRAVNAYDNFTAKLSRAHNDTNMLCLRGWGMGKDKIEGIVKTWLKSDFSGIKRHKRRVRKLDSLR